MRWLPTSVKMDPDGPKGHFSFNFPIQPDDGEKDTLFQISYSVPYASGKYSFKSVVTLPADNFAVLLPKSMTLTAGAGAEFKPVNEDPGLQTMLMKNAVVGKATTAARKQADKTPARRATSREAGLERPSIRPIR
jgi:hypothetical protein